MDFISIENLNKRDTIKDYKLKFAKEVDKLTDFDINFMINNKQINKIINSLWIFNYLYKKFFTTILSHNQVKIIVVIKDEIEIQDVIDLLNDLFSKIENIKFNINERGNRIIIIFKYTFIISNKSYFLRSSKMKK
jgi:hypothetical protein